MDFEDWYLGTQADGRSNSYRDVNARSILATREKNKGAPQDESVRSGRESGAPGEPGAPRHPVRFRSWVGVTSSASVLVRADELIAACKKCVYS